MDRDAIDAEQINANTVSQTKEKEMEKHGLRIAVLDRGWVFVGHVETDEEWCHIKDASCVRLWGTKNGIGELAQSGPLSGTKLDPTLPLKVSRKALLFLVECDAAKWKRCSCDCACHAKTE